MSIPSLSTDLSKQQYNGEYTEAIAAGIQDRGVPETGHMPAIALRRWKVKCLQLLEGCAHPLQRERQKFAGRENHFNEILIIRQT